MRGKGVLSSIPGRPSVAQCLLAYAAHTSLFCGGEAAGAVCGAQGKSQQFALGAEGKMAQSALGPAGHDRDAVSCLYCTRVGVGLTIARQLPVRAAGALTVRGGPFSLNNRNADHSWAPGRSHSVSAVRKEPPQGVSVH